MTLNRSLVVLSAAAQRIKTQPAEPSAFFSYLSVMQSHADVKFQLSTCFTSCNLTQCFFN